MAGADVVIRLLFGLVLSQALAWSSPGGTVEPSPHPLHLSTAQLALEEDAAYLRIRIFKDDLEAALARFAGRDSVVLEASPELDDLFQAYFRETFELWCDSGCSASELLSSGEDFDSGEDEERMWWYLLRFPAQGQVNGVRISNAVLFGLFRDQRNIVRVLHTPSDTRRTLYFAAPDDEPQSIAFD